MTLTIKDQARLSLSTKLHVLVSYSAGSLGTRLRERLLGHKRKLLGHVPQCFLSRVSKLPRTRDLSL